MKNKIGCVIIIKKNHNNYGTSLQGFATIKYIEKLGFPFEIILYKKQRSLFELLKVLPFYILSGGWHFVIKRSLKKKFLKKIYPSYFINLSYRTKAVNAFKEKYLYPLCKTYKGYEDLRKGSLSYDVVMVGSDQVWNPMSLYARFYNLLFVEASIPTFSYASSFGCNQIPYWQHKQTKAYLEQLTLVGVREIQGKKIVESLSNKKAIVVADPTLLLTSDEWQSYSRDIVIPDFDINSPYIFCYVLGSRETIRNEIKKLKEKTGYKVVYLRHVDDYIKQDEFMGDYCPYDLDPLQFIRLVSHASYVCTDSFHGTIFSVLFHRQFLTFYRVNPKNGKSTHSRIDNLLQELSLESRLFNEKEEDVFISINKSIDYNSVDIKIDEMRKKSSQFFLEGLTLAKGV